jgi:mono/diheme cytochrome c family protein
VKNLPTAICRAGWKSQEKIMSRNILAGSAGLIALGALAAAQALAQSPGVYNMEQATKGHSAYVASCGGCHRANLAGGGDAPALGGNGFISSFGNRSTKDLYKFIATSMPAGAPGSLGEEAYTNITAYLLYANGAKPGSSPFSKDTDVKVSSIADGKVLAEAIAPPSLGKMAAAEARARAEAPPPAHGLTVAGTVALYLVVPKGFLPAQDTGLLSIAMEAPQDASFRRVSELQQEVTRIVLADPAVVQKLAGLGYVPGPGAPDVPAGRQAVIASGPAHGQPKSLQVTDTSVEYPLVS